MSGYTGSGREPWGTNPLMGVLITVAMGTKATQEQPICGAGTNI
jgi:hypothetical protein